MRFSQRLLFAGFAALCLVACRDSLDDEGVPSPTPTPDVSPTPTPEPGVTPTPTPDDSDFSGTGAAMTSSSEQVTVLSSTVEADTTTVMVQRANGEIWEFVLDGTVELQVGDLIFYQNSALVFGDPLGNIALANGATAVIVSAVRIQ